MAELGSMFVRLGIKDRDFTRGMQKAGKNTKALTKHVDALGKRSKALGRSFLSLKNIAIGAFVGWGLKRLAGSFVDAASTSEQYRVRLTALLRSQEEGNRLFKEMADYAGRVPFEYEKVMESATALSGVMSGGVDEIKQWMPLIGDLAAVTGLTIQDTTQQVIRMYSAGAASADLFRERGVLAMLGFQAGVSYSAEETRKKMMEAWTDADSQFRGATEELAKTWDGLMSMMRDAWFQFRNMVMEAGLFDSMKAGVKKVLDIIKELKREGKLDEWARETSIRILEIFQKLVMGTGKTLDALNKVWQSIRREVKALWETYQAFPTWVQALGVVGAIMMGKKGTLAAVGILHLLASGKNAIEGIGEAFKGNIKFTELATMNAEELAGALEKIRKEAELSKDIEIFKAPIYDPESFTATAQKIVNIIDEIIESTNKSATATEKNTRKTKENLEEFKRHKEYLEELDKWNKIAVKSNEAFAKSALSEYEALKKLQWMEENILRLRKERAAAAGVAVPVVISEEEWEKAFGAGEKVAKESINAIEEAYKTFLERTQGAFADTFYDIFKGQWEGWEDLMDKMEDLMFRVLAEMAAKAMMTKLAPQIGVGAAAGAGATGAAAGAGGLGILGALVGYGIISGMAAKREAEAKQRRQQIEAWRKELKQLEIQVKNLVEPSSKLTRALDSVNDLFDRYVTVLKNLGSSVTLITHAEEQRAIALARVRDEIEKQFLQPIKDMIAQFTLAPRAYELYQLEQWYNSQIELARELGAEAVKLLREAYELAKKQYYLKEREGLLTATAGYQTVIETAGMTALETQIYLLQAAYDAIDWSETTQAIVDLKNAIAGLTQEAIALPQELVALESAQAQAITKQATAWTTLVDRVNSEMRRQYGNIPPPPPYGTWIEYFLGTGAMLATAKAEHDAWLLAKQAAAAATIAVQTFAAALPGELTAIAAAIAALEAELGPLEDALSEAGEAALAAWQAQLDAIKRGVAEDWAAIIRKHTMTEQELALFALEQWYTEQLAAAEALGMALDDLNLAYQLQHDAIMETTEAVEDLTNALDQTIKSIDDMIMQLTGGALAPVQSAAFYQAQYAGLLGGAQVAQGAEAIAEAVQDLNAFIPTYLDFMKSYGMDYAALTASIVADLQALREGILPTAQFGGLTTGPTIAGEHGPELITPMYEPEHSSFMQSMGLSGEQEIHVHVHMDGREIGNVTTKQLQSNPDLVRQVENIARRVTH